MILSNWFHSIGGLLLLRIHISHTLVVLTANVEDIRRIAQKFVSESLAEKLTDFLVKATAKEVDVSIENIENERIRDVSGNDWTTNAKTTTKAQHRRPYSKPTLSERYYKSKDQMKYNFNQHKSIPNSNNPNPISSRYVHRQQPFIKTREKPKQNPYTFNIKSRIPAIVSQDGVDEHKYNSNFIRSRFIQNADTVNEVIQRANTLSTKKEKNEFDQYDNTNYPKADVIATSGAVALTKPPESETDENKDYE